ncbi:zinc transporter ZupT [Parabacteroides sp. PFB2-12]|uniref:hypothetical protein n=1 Tax=unclassified Parabacteroides TaxID=2649774 RepID=UPI0024734AFD|nr:MULTISPECIES: hypothetical protein [unclassified Parabacteroides]MDH6342878.1 zinc transporter ZupT [Parabacteroides sp. PM6-13]MDH6390492.1 zinc transporter ZupT [Parabacteroides sp. PFB2-12]
MKKKKRIIRILVIIAAIIAIAATIAYFVLEPEKPWLAFYIACCGGVLVVNFILSIIFVNKNFKDRE